MEYQTALSYLWSFNDYEKVPGLSPPGGFDLRRVEELLRKLGNPHLGARTIHLAGTKGKGSTAVMVATVLTASGYRTGLFTSPHLHTLRERITIDGELITEGEFARLMERLQPEVESVNRCDMYGQLTTFEILTALAFSYFRGMSVDFRVLEVGLGGRLDATNVVNPEVCIITPISLDHTQALGCTIAQIANEKAGIIKPGSVVVSSPQLPEVDRIIEGVCRKNECKLIKVGADVMWQGENFDLSGQSFRVRGRRGSYRLNIPLLGGHQMKNATTAVAALEALAEVGIEILADNITAGLSRVNWPGRLQVLQQHPMLVVDGAHNVESARRLKEAISQYFDFDRLILVIGVSVDKDVAGIIRELAPLSHAVIVTRSRHPRSAPQAMLAGEFERLGVKTQSTEDVASAVELALAVSGERDLICGTGSLFVAAEAIEYIERREVG